MAEINKVTTKSRTRLHDNTCTYNGIETENSGCPVWDHTTDKCHIQNLKVNYEPR